MMRVESCKWNKGGRCEKERQRRGLACKRKKEAQQRGAGRGRRAAHMCIGKFNTKTKTRQEEREGKRNLVRLLVEGIQLSDSIIEGLKSGKIKGAEQKKTKRSAQARKCAFSGLGRHLLCKMASTVRRVKNFVEEHAGRGKEVRVRH